MQLGVRVNHTCTSESRTGSGCLLASLVGDLGMFYSFVALNPCLVFSEMPKPLL